MLDELISGHLTSPDREVDVVAIGKAAPEMAQAAVSQMPRARRTLIVTDGDGAHVAREHTPHAEVLVGDHPLPGAGSFRAADRVIEFLHESEATHVVFAISGGGSSLCAATFEPVAPDDVAQLWRAALRTGLDIGELNRVRASFSRVAAGALLDHVTGTASAVVMTDNVVTGPAWVSSGPTYSSGIDLESVTTILDRLTSLPRDVRHRLDVARNRRIEFELNSTPAPCTNAEVVSPSAIHDAAVSRALQLGYEVVSLGDRVVTNVHELANQIGDALQSPRTCVVAVGEVSVSVTGIGRGGRCQVLAAHVARYLDGRDDIAFVGRATDGRDHEADVGGARVNGSSMSRVRDAGVDCDAVLAQSDSHAVLNACNGLIAGERTGWNLCDLYVGCSR